MCVGPPGPPGRRGQVAEPRRLMRRGVLWKTGPALGEEGRGSTCEGASAGRGRAPCCHPRPHNNTAAAPRSAQGAAPPPHPASPQSSPTHGGEHSDVTSQRASPSTPRPRRHRRESAGGGSIPDTETFHPIGHSGTLAPG